MSDNVLVDEGADVAIGADEISSVKYQRIKIIHGADGVNDGDVATGNPLPVTVSGVSTATKQDAQTALLTTIDADTSTIAGAVSGSEMQVDIVSSALPSGAATSALQTSSEALLTTIAGAVSGSEMQVDIVSSALPSGAATEATLVKNTDFTMFRDPALSNTAVAVKAAAGTLAGVHIYNPNSSSSFVQFYNVAQGSVTVGTTTPNYTLFIPAQGGVDGGILPIAFSTAITIAATTTITGGTAPSTALLVNLQYK